MSAWAPISIKDRVHTVFAYYVLCLRLCTLWVRKWVVMSAVTFSIIHAVHDRHFRHTL